tara:strand:+ start:1473 stop:2189 length:717 start_codon:yes stop_codon:yes gene_type:complete
MNIVALMIGKKNSSGVPGKNISNVLGKKLCEYPLIAAKNTKSISEVFVSTNCNIIEKVGLEYGCNIIKRPPKFDDPDTLTEDVLSHAHLEIKKKFKKKIDYYVLLYANGGFINENLINSAITKLKGKPSFDSCVGTVSADMFTPIRAKKITNDGELKPFIDLNFFENISSNRDSAGKAYFIDLSLQIIKPHCFETMNGNQKPFLWLGNKILSFEKDFGGDLDAYWQYPVLESWLNKQK